MADTPQQPWWLQPLITVVTQVGVPTVIAGVLLWFVLFRLDSTLHIIEHAESDRTALLISMQDNVVKTLEHQTEKFTDVMRANVEVNKRIADMLEHRSGRATP